MTRIRWRVIGAAAAVVLLLGICATAAFSSFDRGNVQVSLNEASVALEAGQTANVTVTATPAQDSQLPGCGDAQCPQTCPPNCVQKDVYGNYVYGDNCSCNSTKFQIYDTTITASSSNPAVASATVNGTQVAIQGVAAGTATITVTGSLREWTSGEEQIAVTVSSAPASVTSSGGGGIAITSSKPSVETEAATSVAAVSAVLNGSITSDNGSAITGYGFLWGTSESSLTNKLSAGSDDHSGSFTAALSNLTAGTTYYFQTYAANSQGTTDGSTLSFTTTGSAPATTTTPTATAPATTQAEQTTAFNDVSVSHWAYSAITSLSSQGIVSGYPDGTFKPEAPVTRAEFAAMLAKALGLSGAGTSGNFTDVAVSSWCYDAVNDAVAAGLVSGTGDHLFAPNALITREQMAVMAAKALGAKAPTVDGTELDSFSDKPAVSNWAVTGMEAAVKADLISGMTSGALAPLDNATRAQAAAMIYKLLAISGK